MKSRVFFSSAKWFGMEFWAFLSWYFYLLRYDLERNSNFFIFCGIPSVFRSAKQTEFRRKESKSPSVSCFAGKNFSRKRAALICGAASLHCLNICPIWTKLCDWKDMSWIIWKIGTSSQECFQRCGNERFSPFSFRTCHYVSSNT